MKPFHFERRHRTDEGQGIAERSLRERVPVDKLTLRDSDAERADELRAAAKKHLLAMAGFTEEEAQENLSPVAEASVSSESALKKELSPEEMEAVWFGEFKTRFDALPKLHKGISWVDVEKSLKADPESMAKLQALDEKGHAMNVFGEENGEFIFASAWDNFEKVSAEHRNIAYDLEGQKLAEKKGYKTTGNAVDIVSLIGAGLADSSLHEKLRENVAINGWAWLKTDASIREAGYVFYGYYDGVRKNVEYDLNAACSFRAELRVKKLSV